MAINHIFYIIFSSLALSLFLSSCDQTENKTIDQKSTVIQSDSNFLFVGTYTKKEGHVDGKAEGIGVYSLDQENGKIAFQSVAKEVINPSFLTVSENQKFLYAVNETGPDVDSAGSISAFAFDSVNKQLKLLNTQSSIGFAPCHINADRKNRILFATNYVGGKVVLLPINEDGTIEPVYQIVTLEGKGEHPRQEASHPHSIVLSRQTNNFAYVADSRNR